MVEIKEIETIDDIKVLVDEFYSSVREDELLADIFNGVIGDNWPAHLTRMYTFWQTILLKEHTYYGSPFPPHSQLPIEEAHFERWLELFHETIDRYFTGETAEEAKWRSERMAEMFLYKIGHYKNNSSRSLI